MKVTTHTGTKPYKLFPFPAIYTLSIYSSPLLVALMPSLGCTDGAEIWRALGKIETTIHES